MIIILYTRLQWFLYVVIVSILLTIIIVWVYYNDVGFNRTTVETIETDKKTKQKDNEIVQTNNITIETEIDKGDDIQAVEPVSLGNFKLTAYCACEICCGIWANNRPVDKDGNEIVYGAIGEELKEGYSIAADPTVIPYRTEIIINGHTYKAQDCGGAIKGNRIDIYFSSHEDALKFGVQYAEVFLIEN